MPPRIPDHKRSAILADIRAAQKPRNQIARDHGVAVGTVTNIARENGLVDAFDRSATKKATEAKVIDHKARLVAIAGRSAGLAERILDSFEDMSDKDWADVSPYTRGLVFGIASDKAKDLAADDSGVEIAVTGLGKLFDGLIERHGDGSDADG